MSTVLRDVLRLSETDPPLFGVSGAVLWGDTLVIAEESTGVIRFFSLAGTQLAAFGGSGDGPGEFRQLDWVQVLADTLFVGDIGSRSVQAFDRRGAHVRTITTQSPRSDVYVRPIGVMASGRPLSLALPIPGRTQAYGTSRVRGEVWRHSADGQPEVRLGSHLGSELYSRRVRRTGSFVEPALLGKRSGIAALTGGYVIVENNLGFVERFDTVGARMAGLVPPQASLARPVTRRELEQAMRLRRSRIRMSGADEIDDRNAPSLLPPFGNYGRVLRFLGANEDFVWVLHFPSGEDVLWRWSVFDVSGSASEAELELSVGAELMDVADSLAVFRIWDDTDVESVVVTRHSLAFSPAEAR